jgi:hypothetical protein
LKCSVCAQDIPEDRYSEHLESEHGVTDDPTAVLIQHLTGLHSTAGEGDGDEGLPDEEPSDADAFEEFLATHPTERAAGADERAQDEDVEEEEDEEAPEEPAAEAHDDEEEDEGPEEDEAAESGEGEGEGEGEQLTDEDEAEFERMLATYPEVDLRKGAPEPRTADADAGTEDAAAGAGAAATTVATADRDDAADRDDKTFAVWDEARPASPEDEEDLVLAVPPAELEKARRRRQAALVGLGVCIILVAIAVIYLLTRDTSNKNNTTATAPATSPTTVSPTILPGPANGEPTTVVSQPPITTAPPATAATPATRAPATTAAPSTDPGSKIVFSYAGATCTASGSLSVVGTITNTNSTAYTFSYTIVLLRSDGTQQGTANGQVSHLGPGARFGPGTIGNGTCTYPLAGGPSPRQQITSISPG